jgi:hypothetical protein
MKEICSIKNKEIFELKKKCKVVQDKISRVVDKIPVGNYNINNNIRTEDQKEESKNNETPRVLQT